MSLFPCEVHNARVAGPLSALYFGLLRGSDRYNRRLRVCAKCLDQVMDDHKAEWSPVDSDGAPLDSSVCATCDSEAASGDRLNPLFVTVYRKGEERLDYFGSYCGDCATQLADVWGLTPR